MTPEDVAFYITIGIAIISIPLIFLGIYLWDRWQVKKYFPWESKLPHSIKHEGSGKYFSTYLANKHAKIDLDLAYGVNKNGINTFTGIEVNYLLILKKDKLDVVQLIDDFNQLKEVLATQDMYIVEIKDTVLDKIANWESKINNFTRIRRASK